MQHYYGQAEPEPSLRQTENVGFKSTISRVTVAKDGIKAMQDNSFGLTSPNINYLPLCTKNEQF